MSRPLLGARILALQPFDTATREGRSAERYRRALLMSASGLVSRSITVITALVSVPLTITYLGDERYGMWLTISSAFAFATVADFGVGPGLLNALSSADGRGDRAAAQRSLSTAVAILLGMAAVWLAVFALVYPHVAWARVFNVMTPLAVREASLTVAALMACWSSSLVLDVVIRTNVSHQDGFVNELWQSFGSLLGLAGVLTAIHFRAGLPILVLAMEGAPTVATLLNGIVLFGWKRPWLRPAWRMVDARVAAALLGSGVWFTVMGLSHHAINASGPLMVAHVLGADQVPQFAVPFRTFAILNVLAALLVNPLWPAYAEALARGDTEWAPQALLRSLKIAFLAAAPPCALLVVAGGTLIPWWIGGHVTPSLSLLTGLALWGVLAGMGTATSSFLYGAGAVRFLGIVRVTQAIVTVPLALVLIHLLGVAGLAWAMAGTELVCRFVPSIVYVSRFVRDMHSRPVRA
jgi:O-antigen/teichoic acid export membrane protein